MELMVHSGLGPEDKQGVEIYVTSQRPDCRVTVYKFKDFNGNVLSVQHFEHGPQDQPE
jgi:hypothetical protein